jgi:hypothetical protein
MALGLAELGRLRVLAHTAGLEPARASASWNPEGAHHPVRGKEATGG